MTDAPLEVLGTRLKIGLGGVNRGLALAVVIENERCPCNPDDTTRKAGTIGDNALMSRAPGVISAVRTADGNLKLIAWAVSAAGAISRAGDSYNLAGTASLITLCQDALSGDAPIVTAVRTADNNLRVITWDD